MSTFRSLFIIHAFVFELTSEYFSHVLNCTTADFVPAGNRSSQGFVTSLVSLN